MQPGYMVEVRVLLPNSGRGVISAAVCGPWRDGDWGGVLGCEGLDSPVLLLGSQRGAQFVAQPKPKKLNRCDAVGSLRWPRVI